MMDKDFFTGLSGLAIALAIVFALWPEIRACLIRKRAESHRLPGSLNVAILILLPAVTLGLYGLVGTHGETNVDDPRITLLRSQMIGMARELERNPDQPELWQRMGLVYKDLQHFGPAEHTLRRALYLRPDSAFLHVELAETLHLRSELPTMPPEARELLVRAISLEPDNLKALWMLATGDFLSGRYENALAWWEQMLPLVPENSTMYSAVSNEAQRARSLLAQ